MFKNIFSNLTNTQKSINREEYFYASMLTLLATSLASLLTLFSLTFLFGLILFIVFFLLTIQRINDTKFTTVPSLILLVLAIPFPFLTFIILMFIPSKSN